MSCKNDRQFSIKNNQGFTLIEVLISVLILSLGVIGIIKLQLTSLQTTQQSNFYSQGMQLANDMANKIRNNKIEMSNSDATNRYLQVNYSANDGAPTTASMCYDQRCNPSQLAAADIYEWLTQINHALPHAKAVICRDAQPWDSDTDALTWECATSNKAAIVIKLGWIEKAAANTSSAPMLALALSP